MKHQPQLPHGELREIFTDIYFIEGQVNLPAPMAKITKSMTVIRDPNDNSLTLVNAMRLDDEETKKLESLGTIKNTLRLAGGHGRDDGYYKEKYGAKVYALKGHVYTRGFKGPNNPEDGYMVADVWLEKGDALPVANAHLKLMESSKHPEALLVLERDGGIIVSGDILQNMPEANEYVNFFGKLIMKKFGFFKPHNIGPGWVKAAEPTKGEMLSILDIAFDHVLPAHGAAVIGGAKEKYRPRIEATAATCRE